ncbi:MAG: hypothetical protein ACXWG8_10270 [Usitatibacter sp.]
MTQVREAILAIGQANFTADDVADQLDVGEESMKAIWKVLGYMTKLDELRRVEDSKPTRWKVIRLNTVSTVPKFKDTALFGAMLGWKLTP